jgi:hypothetical protein
MQARFPPPRMFDSAAGVGLTPRTLPGNVREISFAQPRRDFAAYPSGFLDNVPVTTNPLYEAPRVRPTEWTEEVNRNLAAMGERPMDGTGKFTESDTHILIGDKRGGLNSELEAILKKYNETKVEVAKKGHVMESVVEGSDKLSESEGFKVTKKEVIDGYTITLKESPKHPKVKLISYFKGEGIGHDIILIKKDFDKVYEYYNPTGAEFRTLPTPIRNFVSGFGLLELVHRHQHQGPAPICSRVAVHRACFGDLNNDQYDEMLKQRAAEIGIPIDDYIWEETKKMLLKLGKGLSRGGIAVKLVKNKDKTFSIADMSDKILETVSTKAEAEAALTKWYKHDPTKVIHRPTNKTGIDWMARIGQGKLKFVKKYLKGQGLPATKKNVEKICNIMDVEGVVFE